MIISTTRRYHDIDDIRCRTCLDIVHHIVMHLESIDHSLTAEQRVRATVWIGEMCSWESYNHPRPNTLATIQYLCDSCRANIPKITENIIYSSFSSSCISWWLVSNRECLHFCFFLVLTARRARVRMPYPFFCLLLPVTMAAQLPEMRAVIFSEKAYVCDTHFFRTRKLFASVLFFFSSSDRESAHYCFSSYRIERKVSVAAHIQTRNDKHTDDRRRR